MKIAVCVPTDFNYYGGVEKHVLRLSEAVRRLGVEVEVFGKAGSASSAAGGGSEFFLPLGSIDARRYDVIHTHSGFHHPRLLEMQMNRLARQRWVHTLHSVALDYLFGCRDWLNWRCYYSTCIEGMWSRYADHVIGVSGSTRIWALRCFGIEARKISVIYNGYSPVAEAEAAESRTEIRRKLGFGPRELVLLFVGRGEDKVKGSHQVAAAMDELYRRFPQIRLLAIPGTGFKPAPWLHTAGQIIHTQMAGYYRAGDILVNASFSEGLPLTIVEAMHAGLPILAAPAGGIPEIIRTEQTGLLLRRDHSDLASLLARLIADESLRQKLGKNARQAAETLTWDHIARQTLKVYQGLFTETPFRQL